MAQLSLDTYHDAVSELALPYGQAQLRGFIKQSPEDFRVVENLGFELAGEGEHLFLYIRKTGITTPQLIDHLCTIVGITSRQVGYSGLKDRHAVTEQWLSLHLPGCRDMPHIEDCDEFAVLGRRWHQRKLKIGSHRSNRFEVRVSGIEGSADKLSSTVDNIKQSGFANYFGEQRFGARRDNVGQALHYLGNARKAKRLSRTRRSLYLSSLRSFLFNKLLSERIQSAIWLRPMEGDLFMLNGSQSVFNDALSDEILERYTALDIHSAISLYGVGESRVQDKARLIEEQVFGRYDELTTLLRQQQLKLSYRSGRALARDLRVAFEPDRQEMHISVELDRGVYLTSLLAQLVSVDNNNQPQGREFSA
jgi:tRNA pseudouridine13 synthase